MIYYFIIEDLLNLYLQKNFHRLILMLLELVFWILLSPLDVIEKRLKQGLAM